MQTSTFAKYIQNQDELILQIMKTLNFLLVVFLSLTMYTSITGIVREGNARDFLSTVSRFPVQPSKIPFVAITLFFCILMLMEYENATFAGKILRVSAEVVLALCLCSVIGFAYTGIILVILADTLKEYTKSQWPFVITILVILTYMLIDYDLISMLTPIIPINTYLAYYRADIGGIMRIGLNVAMRANIFLFLLYMILMIIKQLSEKERILALNMELEVLNQELQERNREVERLTETRERNRLAREIHDTLGHALTGIITGVEACVTLMDVAPEAAKTQMGAIQDVARQGIKDVRRSVNALRPDTLDRLSLKAAILKSVNEMKAVTGAEITIYFETELLGFDEEEENVIYRIVQECITNAIRHGKADKIDIMFSRDPGILLIQINDNGVGCEEIQKGFGLHHMEERVHMLKGELIYDGREGFYVEARIPIRWGVEERKHD